LVVAACIMVLITSAGAIRLAEGPLGSIWPVAFAHSTVNTFLAGAGFVVILSPTALAYTAGESGPGDPGDCGRPPRCY